jgi:hypothetical protein
MTFFLYFLIQSVPPKLGLAKRGKVPTSGGANLKLDAKSTLHHLNGARNYIQLCNFSDFQTILLNYITNDYL